MYTREWLISRTRFYQDFGFFADYIGLSDEDLADRIIHLRQAETDREIHKLFNEGHDWLIIGLDTQRVLSAATDILYAEEPPEYDFEVLVETMQRLSAISRGSFVPENIQEIEPGAVQFTLNNQIFSLVPEGPPDDPLILLSQINPLIVETNYQFKQWDLSPDVFVLAMTMDEVDRLGWRFLADRWMFDDNGFAS